jgi:hypothetical protein
MPGELRVSERLYAALLGLYPKTFRAAYGEQMRLTFRDSCRAAYQRSGAGGLLALWLPTLLDLLKSALEARARQGEITMSKERWIAWAGPLTLIVGVLWIMTALGGYVLVMGLPGEGRNLVISMRYYSFWFSFVPMLFALIGIWLRFHQAAGRLARLGLALSVTGCAGFIFFLLAAWLLGSLANPEAPRWPFYAAGYCHLSFFIGHTLFGVDVLRYRLLPRWNLSPLMALYEFVLSSFLPYPLRQATEYLLFTLTGACWVLMGMAMMDRRREPQPAAAS